MTKKPLRVRKRIAMWLTPILQDNVERMGEQLVEERVPGITHADGTYNTSAIIAYCIKQEAERRGITVEKE